jgi:hypothetical protein
MAALILAWLCGLRASSKTLLAIPMAAALLNSFMAVLYPRPAAFTPLAPVSEPPGSTERGELSLEQAALALVLTQLHGQCDLAPGISMSTQPGEQLAPHTRQQV